MAEAIELSRQTIGLDPQNDDSRIQLCNLLLQNSDPVAALDALGTDSVDVQTLSTQLRLRSLARIAGGSEDIADSIPVMQEAVHLAPWEDKSWLGLAYAATKRGAAV